MRSARDRITILRPLIANFLLLLGLSGCMVPSTGSTAPTATATATLTPTATPTPAATPGGSWLFVGDSLTYGYSATVQTNRFADRVAHDLNVSDTVLGYPGGTVKTALTNNPTLPSATVTVVELGTNDYFHAQGSPQPMPLDTLNTFASQYGQLLSEIHSSHVICLGVWLPRQLPNAVGLEPEDYDAEIQKVCPGSYVDLLALFQTSANHNPAGLPTWLGPSDNFHPSDAGHAAIAAAIEAASRT